jgi:ligand-binding SRPBCC domain-containing protein
MIFLNSFQIRAPLDQVADFHSLSANMAAITPPPVNVRIHEAPKRLKEGDQMSFTLWIGPLPVQWQALITDVSETGFIDRQISGPFEKWEHHHNFNAIDAASTLVSDEVHIELSRHPLKYLIGLGMALNLPLLLIYRGWKTRRLLKEASR